MTETVKKRRSWPWVVLSLGAVVLSGRFAWQNRPLNETEIWMLGPWTNWGADNPGNFFPESFQFEPDRRYSYNSDETGTWSAAGDEVQLRPDGAAWTFLCDIWSVGRHAEWRSRTLKIGSQNPSVFEDLHHGEAFVRGTF
jgi:hypothetical protein